MCILDSHLIIYITQIYIRQYFFEKFLTNFTNKYIIYNIIAVDAINNIEHPVVNIQLNIANCDSFSDIILYKTHYLSTHPIIGITL